jgi:hypothetical protein
MANTAGSACGNRPCGEWGKCISHPLGMLATMSVRESGGGVCLRHNEGLQHENPHFKKRHFMSFISARTGG